MNENVGRSETAEEYRCKAAECLRDGHEWALSDAHPDWYDGRTYQCDGCDAVEFSCVHGAEGTLYEDPEHDPGISGRWPRMATRPAAGRPVCRPTRRMRHCPSAVRRVARRRPRVGVESPNLSLTDPEWAMAVGLGSLASRSVVQDPVQLQATGPP